MTKRIIHVCDVCGDVSGGLTMFTVRDPLKADDWHACSAACLAKMPERIDSPLMVCTCATCGGSGLRPAEAPAT